MARRAGSGAPPCRGATVLPWLQCCPSMLRRFMADSQRLAPARAIRTAGRVLARQRRCCAEPAEACSFPWTVVALRTRHPRLLAGASDRGRRRFHHVPGLGGASRGAEPPARVRCAALHLALRHLKAGTATARGDARRWGDRQTGLEAEAEITTTEYGVWTTSCFVIACWLLLTWFTYSELCAQEALL